MVGGVAEPLPIRTCEAGVFDHTAGEGTGAGEDVLVVAATDQGDDSVIAPVVCPVGGVLLVGGEQVVGLLPLADRVGEDPEVLFPQFGATVGGGNRRDATELGEQSLVGAVVGEDQIRLQCGDLLDVRFSAQADLLDGVQVEALAEAVVDVVRIPLGSPLADLATARPTGTMPSSRRWSRCPVFRATTRVVCASLSVEDAVESSASSSSPEQAASRATAATPTVPPRKARRVTGRCLNDG